MLSFTVSLLLLSILANGRKNMEARIVNGVPVQASEYPFIVDVRTYYPLWDTVDDSFCTASLLRLEKPATILTAAHCVEDITNQSLAVYLLRSDADDFYSNSNNFTFHPAYKFVMHPDYNKTSIDSDIALIFLNESIANNKRLSTVELPSFDDDTEECCTDGESLRVMGYGADYSDGPATDTLEYANKQFMPRKECQRRVLHYLSWRANNCNYTDANYTDLIRPGDYSFDGDYSTTYNWSSGVTENMICAIGDNTDSCQGDSGGPLIKTDTNIQVGIVSYGYGCNQGVPGVYVNLGLYNDWINQEIEKEIDGGVISFNATDSTTTTKGGDNMKTTLNENIGNLYSISMIMVIGTIINSLF